MSLLNELKRRNVIRVGLAYVLIAWVLLQAADFGLDMIEAPNWVIQALFMLAAIGLPGVLIFSWVFEMTPEGIKKESEIDRSQSITSSTGRKLNSVIFGALILAVAYLLVDKLYLSKSPGSEAPAQVAGAIGEAPQAIEENVPEKASVAVLPFVNMSDSKENEYFSDGLTETLLHMLAQLPDLQVAARTSSFAFKGQNKSVGEIAAVLGVAHILEGSVQRSGGQMRITAQLVRADDGFHVWSQNYTRPVEDIFAIQDEIATDVADALGSSLLGSGEAQIASIDTSDLSAYDSYLRGLEEQAKYSYVALPIAESHFKTALATDPEFTQARLALIRNNLLKWSTGMISDEQVQEINKPLIQQVRDQDPDNRRVRAYELVPELRNRTDIDIAEWQMITDELRGLLAAIPTETFVRRIVGQVLAGYFDDPEASLEVLEAGLMIDPLDAGLYSAIGRVQRDEGQVDMAEASLKRSLDLAPDNPNAYWDLRNLEMERNNLVGALNWGRMATEVDPQDHELASWMAQDLYALKLPEEGDRWLAKVQALQPGSPMARSVELDRAWARGERDQQIMLAQAMIEDQVTDRGGAFGNAIFSYGVEMAKAGRAEEAYAKLVEIRPELVDYEQIAGDFNGAMMQWVSIGIMSSFESFEKRQQAWQQLTQQLDAMGWPWRQPESFAVTWDLLFQGETEAAIQQFLDGPLSEPHASNLRMHTKTFDSLLRDVYSDPRVVARMAELEREYDQMRSDVSDLMLQPEWNP